MPELPEVETIRLALCPWFEGRRIEGLELRAPSLRYALDPGLPALLSGRTVGALGRRGKYMLMHLEGGDGLIIHLGMSGRFITHDGAQRFAPQRHDHVIFHLPDNRCVAYRDPRRFGFILPFKVAEWWMLSPFDRMGPEPLDDAFDGQALQVALRGRKAPIKIALLDQGVVAGIGNIYACEALYMAGIHPQTPAGTLGARACENLARAIKDVLQKALAAGGSTLRDYKRPGGDTGYFQHDFSVYGRAGEVCRRCEAAFENAMKKNVIMRSVQGGRSTFYCPNCQKRQRGKASVAAQDVNAPNLKKQELKR